MLNKLFVIKINSGLFILFVCFCYFLLMKPHQKILELPSNLSKLLDSLCFELSVNFPDENSLSLIEIVEWRINSQISQDEFKQLYRGWLQSKGIYDLFTVKQIKTYPKDQLVNFEGPIKKLLNAQQINSILQILNNTYNQIFIQKRIKGFSSSPKTQIKYIEQIQQLFSFLDLSGSINLRLNELFFLAAAILICEDKYIQSDLRLFCESFKRILLDFSQIHGSVSLRSFKNYFLVQKSKSSPVKTIYSVLLQVQKLASFSSESLHQVNILSNTLQESLPKVNTLPNIFQESLQKWKSYPQFRNKQKRIQFIKRIFEQNQRLLFFKDQIESSNVYEELKNKYGKQMLNCLQIDSYLVDQFLQILSDTANKYINIFQKLAFSSNKIKPQKTQCIDSIIGLGKQIQSLQNSANKKKMDSLAIQSITKNIPKTAFKERTPQKKKKTTNQFTTSNNYTSFSNYRNRTPTHNNHSQIYSIHKDFGSAEKHTHIKTVRQTTPTISTLSFLTEAPRTYRAAQKKGLNHNNIYDKLFFFRNKRVESYEIVMKRLKNK